jgi:probable F420-dependent oxidoreductase
MKVGLFSMFLDSSVPVFEIAPEVDQRGFESMYFPEHTHIPLQTLNPSGQPVQEMYKRFIDPVVSMSMAVAVTKQLRVGTGILLVAQHNHFVLAKELATIDHFSGGRLLMLGIGYGWNTLEMADHGLEPSQRRTIAREKVEAMRALWSQDEASYEGRFIKFGPCWQYPKPAQPAGIPVVLGARPSEKTYRAVVAFADGWLPHGANHALVWPADHEDISEDDGVPDEPLPEILEGIATIRRLASEAGRGPSTIDITIFRTRCNLELIKKYADAGVDRVVLDLPCTTRDRTVRVLDRYAGCLEEISRL